jgi:transposase
MAKPLLTDELWNVIEPHIPVKRRRKTHPGRKRLPNRACLTGILFVLRSGIPWELLPQEMGCGSGMTCWRRLRDWQEAGIWQTIHEILLARLRSVDQIDFTRCAVDSASVRAVGGAKAPAPAL